MRHTEAYFTDQHAAGSLGNAAFGCEQSRLGNLSSEGGRGGKIVDGITRHTNAKQEGPGYVSEFAVEATPPPKRVNHLRDSFAQHERNQSPPERAQFAPKFLWSDTPKKNGKQRGTQRE